MSEDIDADTDALAEFLREYDRAMREYEKGYTDADATLSRVDRAVKALREDGDR
jgi:hypothetical protein